MFTTRWTVSLGRVTFIHSFFKTTKVVSLKRLLVPTTCLDCIREKGYFGLNFTYCIPKKGYLCHVLVMRLYSSRITWLTDWWVVSLKKGYLCHIFLLDDRGCIP